MAYGKKNQVNTNPLSYNIGLLGESGCGKSTLIKEVCEKLVGEDGYLFAECGYEQGADAIQNINYINCSTWNSEYDELNNDVGFNLLVEDIIENKEQDYPKLKVLVVDTYDQLRKIVEPEVIRLYNKQHPDKRVSSVSAAFGGFFRGEDKCDDIIIEKLFELKKVGVSFIIIGHVKLREITDVESSINYSQLTTDMSLRSFNKIRNKLHFLGVASISRDFSSEKRGGKDVTVVSGEKRKITFRDDNYSIDSKSRFADIVDSIPFDPDAFIKAMTDAIEKELAKGGKTVEQAQKEEKKINKLKEEKAKEYSESVKNGKIDAERNEELIDIVKSKYTNANDETKAKVKELMAQYEIPNFKTTEVSTKGLEKIVGLLS